MNEMQIAALLAVGVTQQQIAEAIGGIAKFRAMQRAYRTCVAIANDNAVERMHVVVYGHAMDRLAVE